LGDEVVLRVLQDHEVVLGDRGCGAEDVSDVHVPVQQRLEGQRSAAVVDRLKGSRHTPVVLLQPLQPVGPFGEFRGSGQHQLVADLGQIGDALQLVLLGGFGDDDQGVLVRRLRRFQDEEVPGQGLGQGVHDLLGGAGGGLGVREEQEVAGVIRDDVDRAVLDGPDVGLAGTDAEVGFGLDPG